ncbi:MAG: Maf family nucleotide pyrophosphatase [Gallionellaceae bacterium]|jgi:septum formation protein|nr:Maf family nucleotide pyrophosphatase [Gallionellaceae bacterium]
MTLPELVLASGSPYRREQLARLGLAVVCDAPEIDEARLPDEAAAAMARRLARAKAQAVAGRHPGAIIIAADQVAARDREILGKPGSAAAQRTQLLASSGQELDFYSALAVLDTRSAALGEHLDHTRCRMRELTADGIDRYVRREPASDCAGGFKVEGLGILLFERIDSEDPSALIGLPLIALGRLLRAAGWELP